MQYEYEMVMHEVKHEHSAIVCGTHGSEHVYIATNWHCAMNIATKRAEKPLQQEKL